jgi:hypothetical protein
VDRRRPFILLRRSSRTSRAMLLGRGCGNPARRTLIPRASAAQQAAQEAARARFANDDRGSVQWVDCVFDGAVGSTPCTVEFDGTCGVYLARHQRDRAIVFREPDHYSCYYVESSIGPAYLPGVGLEPTTLRLSGRTLPGHATCSCTLTDMLVRLRSPQAPIERPGTLFPWPVS